jgi:hypothetical protein
MHPRCSRNAVREKPGVAGTWDMPSGVSYAHDKRAGAFVVLDKILVRCQESGPMLGDLIDI